MKRIISLILVSFLFVMLFTGCHGAKERASFAMPDAFDTEREYEITFWAKNDTNVTQTRIYEKAIRDFEALYPNIHVELKLYTEAKIKAQYRYGMSLGSNGVTMQSYVEAFEYIALAASMGYNQAHNEIAKMHSAGGDLASYFEGPFFVPDSYVETSDSLYSKAMLGEAMNKLGDTFFEGKTIRKNEAAAARCYRFAAELSNVDAAYSYGWCLRHGVGVHENDAEAVKWLKMAADKGNANAAYSYGLSCEEGSSTGVKNKREALYYYRMAAGAGHREAAERFLMLSEGEKE